jgi:hypothetical protein
MASIVNKIWNCLYDKKGCKMKCYCWPISI